MRRLKEWGFALVLAFLLLAGTPGGAWATGEGLDPTETLFQVSTLDALLAGDYEGSLSLGELKQYGNLGLGTFDALDGEMIVLDGVVYQAKVDGSVVKPADGLSTPFAAVTSFEPDLLVQLKDVKNLKDLLAKLEAEIPSPNYVYALRCKIKQTNIRTRSVPAQNPPYVPLAQAVKDQIVVERPGATGTLMGFWCPQWLGKLNAPGLHLHYLSGDLTQGGHLLDIESGFLVFELDFTPALTVALPQNQGFAQADLDQDRAGQTKAVEHQTAGQ